MERKEWRTEFAPAKIVMIFVNNASCGNHSWLRRSWKIVPRRSGQPRKTSAKSIQSKVGRWGPDGRQGQQLAGPSADSSIWITITCAGNRIRSDDVSYVLCMYCNTMVPCLSVTRQCQFETWLHFQPCRCCCVHQAGKCRPRFELAMPDNRTHIARAITRSSSSVGKAYKCTVFTGNNEEESDRHE